MAHNSHQRLHNFATLRNWRCFYCGQETHCGTCQPELELLLSATRDHRIPVSKNGKSIPHNKVLACQDCNQKKANRILGQDETIQMHIDRSRRPVRRPPSPLTVPMWKACSPHWYKSEQLAQFSAQALLVGTGKTFEPFWCRFCNHWHLQPVEDSETDLAG